MKTLLLIVLLALGSCTVADKQYFADAAIEYAKFRVEKAYPVIEEK